MILVDDYLACRKTCVLDNKQAKCGLGAGGPQDQLHFRHGESTLIA